MPKGLVRYQNCGALHFITFSCYRRRPLLADTCGYNTFEHELEALRAKYEFTVSGYVLMPEHVHLLVGEPRNTSLATALQLLKQNTSRKLNITEDQFWQCRYYDFNVWSEVKRVEKLCYMHRNRSGADLSKSRKTGLGPHFFITLPVRSKQSKSSQDGPLDGESNRWRRLRSPESRLPPFAALRMGHAHSYDSEGAPACSKLNEIRRPMINILVGQSAAELNHPARETKRTQIVGREFPRHSIQ
jgi:putative transposase